MNEPLIAKIMSQAQAFASAWSLIGSPFGDDDQVGQAEAEKVRLRRMISALIRQRDALLSAAIKVNALSIQTDAHNELRSAIARVGDE